MDQNASNSQDELRRRFPNLRPLKGAPWLGTINGFGCSLYGQRDRDVETGTYVKTRCLCALFVPILALGAYRVADAGGRTWYFFGKEPLSLFARTWNGIVAALAVLLSLSGAWHAYVSSPTHQARQELNRAAQLQTAHQPLQAAGIYQRLLLEQSPFADESRQGLKSCLEQCLQSDSPDTVAAAFRLIATLPPRVNQPSPLVPDAAGRGRALVEKLRPKDPDSALKVLDAVAALEPKKETLTPPRLELLKEVVAANPDNTNRVVELALLYEANEQLDVAVKLLRPCRAKLGATEGARILGQSLLQEGKHQQAYDLLFPYVQTRLESLRALEKAYTNTLATVYNRALADLKQGNADRSFYEAYDKASKPEQAAMVDGYLQKRVQNDPAYKRALAALTEANKIVHVTLDLGIVQLGRAQDLKDPAARKAELEAAEKTFLAIRGLAGESEEYRLFLGQVYYWLGRSKEGQELFDQLLASSKRSFSILMALGHTLRDVGEEVHARTLVEEAYRTAKTNEQKFAAAAFRAHLQKDIEDQIAWLEKSEPAEPAVQVALNNARGDQALQQGNKDLAAQYLRKAIQGYDNQSRSAPVLNNCGLAYLNLYEATGNLADHQRGLELLEEAIGLDPGNSILLINTLHILTSRAVMDVVRDSIHVESLGESAGPNLLAHLYLDEPGRRQVYQRLRQTESMKKALGYLDKALLLAPKNVNLYELALYFQSGFEDLAELQKLQQRFSIAQPDLTEARQEALQAYQGAKDKEYLEEFQNRIRSLEALLQAPAVKDHPLTLERVTVSLNGLRQNAALYGRETDSQQLLAEAVAAHAKHASAATHSALIAALCFRANDELSQQNPDYAGLARQTRRALAPQYLLAFVLERGGPLAEVARKNASVLRVLALEKESRQRFPSFPSIQAWALLRTVEPAEAGLIAKEFTDNALARLVDQLQYQFNPMSASAALERYWTQRMLGDEKQAAETYDAAVRRGIPLPAR